MRSRAVRLTLTLLAVGALAAAAYLTWAAEERASRAREASAAFERTRLAAVRETLELRAAQQAYVAAGQSETFWIGKAAAGAEALHASLSTLATASTSQATGGYVEQALQALQDFEQVDRRARNYASSGQMLLASDMIFSDGLETTTKIVDALEQARAAGVEDLAGILGTVRGEQLLAGAAAGLVVLIALLLLTPRPGGDDAAVAAAEPTLAPEHADGLDLDALLMARTPAGAHAPQAALDGSPVPLDRLAAVCSDLARLDDTNSLSVVLERAASALGASGLVLWVADPDGKELMPVAAHGYPANVLSRMGTLKADAENATAAAFRTGLLQTVKADALSHGAIAAPLVTPAGCRGVMSAEVRHDGEKQPARLAAAAIVAAQLATLVGPPAGRAHDRNTAAL